MRRATFLVFAVFGFSATVFGQAAANEPQTLQALLTEVRELRQELRFSLARIQTAQILLSRLQTQQSVVTHAADRFDEARAKFDAAQDRRQHEATEFKRLEDSLSSEENPAQQKMLEDEIVHFKSELEASTAAEQQSQAIENECEQQLRIERDKLDAINAQLDEILKSMGSSNEQGIGAAR
jgi:DNA repair exonuclease SbcCD ATPase subunit